MSRLVLLLSASIVVIATAIHAQPLQTGVISGVVTDATNAVLPGVSVTITSEERGISRASVTDESGRYTFLAVPIGRYTVTASLQGFGTAQSADNLVATDKTTTVTFTLKVGAITDAVEVVGDVPIVDRSSATGDARLRSDEFEKLPVGRSYQSLLAATAGVVAASVTNPGSSNGYALGALPSNNLWVVDAVDTTDPTTGTFGTNLNYEAIEEMAVYTSAVSAEYGRAQGAIVSIITKSGTNRFEGSAKYLFSNDDWNAQNSTTSEVSNASLARVKFDNINPVYTFTAGGPLYRNRAWFFGAYELSENTTPQRQTTGPIPEDYQQITESNYVNVRATVQPRVGHTAWIKFFRSPTDGFVTDYWPGFGFVAGEREALTAQNQNASNWAAQWSGAVRNNWAIELAFADYSSRIDVTTFESSGRLADAPIYNLADNRIYNGASYDGFVDRPRRQINGSSNWFLNLRERSHNVKIGFDVQAMESGALFKFPNGQLYTYSTYNQATNTGEPVSRQDYETGDSTSSGRIYTLYARDKFELADRVSLEAGVRWERQTGDSDLGVETLATNVLAPRLSGTADISGDGKTLVLGSYGRYYAGVIQSLSDQFAGVPQQSNYDLHLWNGSQYVFSSSVDVGGSGLEPDLSLQPSHMDEFTVGFQRQFGRNLGVGARFISRTWGDLIDDVQTLRSDGTIDRRIVNYQPAERSYRGAQFTLERRMASNWFAQASYTFSRTEGNHFLDPFTPLGDFLNADCLTTIDPSIGANGRVSCAEVQEGANATGRPSYDRPHNLKLNAAYNRPFGPVDVTIAAASELLSKQRYTRQRGMTVLVPGTTQASGQAATYFYEPLGSSPVPGVLSYLDFATEATWRITATQRAGLKLEAFNLTNTQEKILSNNVAWCGVVQNASCRTAVDNFGKATARGSFLAPRQFRFSLLYRF